MNKLNVTKVLFFLFFFPLVSYAQGWERTYDGGRNESLSEAVRTPDGGVMMLGNQANDNVNVGDQAFLYKTDVDGNLQWMFYDSIYKDNFVNPLDVFATSDGNYMVSSLYGASLPMNSSVIQKITPGGTVLWSNVLLDPYHEYVTEVAETSDGGYILMSSYSTSWTVSSIKMNKVDVDGNVIWERIFEEDNVPMFGNDMIVNSEDEIIIAGSSGYANGDYQPAIVKKLDETGNTIWEQEYDNDVNNSITRVIELETGELLLLGGMGDFITSSEVTTLIKTDSEGNQTWLKEYPSISDGFARGLLPAADGGYAIGGHRNTGNGTDDFFLLKVDIEGNEQWIRDFGRSGDDNLVSLMPAPNGGYFLAGRTVKSNGEEDVYLINTDVLGRSLTNILSGQLYHDTNNNCSFDAGEEGLGQWLIEVEQEDAHYLRTTDIDGNYSFTLDTGVYAMNVYPISAYWELCDSSFTVEFTGTDQQITQNIPAQSLYDCPLLDVSIGTPFIRRCFPTVYTVQYCNYGTTLAEDAFVEVSLDPIMEVTGTSIPIESSTDFTYTFLLGDVGVGECGSFTIDVLAGNPATNCDSIPLGTTHCVAAHIFPDSICIPSNDWSGASVEVEAVCEGDSITFIIQNVGSAPTQSLNYIVVEDDVILYQEEYTLGVDEIRTITVAANGATFRLESEQEPFHPGNSMPSISLEACGEEGTTFSFGFINLFAQDDGNSFVDIDCQQNIGAYDPNDKQGLPLGRDEEHYIERNQDIEYMIRFQNTGTDTAFNVVIKDELSEFLNIRSVRPGASSHPYTFDISGSGTLSFTFDNIMLPDSNVNEPASHGFVKFKVAQQLNLPLETQIHNMAAIYFDFNAPIITNETLHTIGAFSTMVSINPSPNPLATVKAAPNPFSTFVQFEVDGVELSDGLFQLYDVTGRLLQQQKITGQQFRFYKNALQSGMYFFRIENEGKLLSSGKLIAQ